MYSGVEMPATFSMLFLLNNKTVKSQRLTESVCPEQPAS
jgi:hypothetical protein